MCVWGGGLCVCVVCVCVWVCVGGVWVCGVCVCVVCVCVWCGVCACVCDMHTCMHELYAIAKKRNCDRETKS